MALTENFRNRWICGEPNEQDVARVLSYITRAYNLYGNGAIAAAKLLVNRGICTESDLDAFFDVSSNVMHDAMLLPDMADAVKRIHKAIEDKEKITVYGDYDVDGITSVTVLYSWLISKGCNADYYIPDRTDEGYGLNNGALDKIKASGTTLLITVDTGTTAVGEAEHATEIGLDVIVTDHHECKGSPECIKEELPKCIAVINPKRPDSKYPFPDLAGVGTVFKLICALENDTERVLERYVEFVAVGTIADIMPLRDENRTIVSLGTEALSKNIPVGLQALISAAKCGDKPIDSSAIAYQIAPRLNAAGRIGDPKISVRLLLSQDKAEADILAAELCEKNKHRQHLEQEIFSDVAERIAKKDFLPDVVIESSPNWNNGVIGIVASRVTEKYRMPCILFCEEGETLKGSARSIPGVNIYSLLVACGDVLYKFGGHEMAAGLTLKKENYELFTAKMAQVAADVITSDKFVFTKQAEFRAPCDFISLETYDAVSLLEPYGSGNPTPVIETDNLVVKSVESVGNGRHLRICLTSSDGKCGDLYGIWFGMTEMLADCVPGDSVDVLYSLGENIFNGRRKLNVYIKDLRPSKKYLDKENSLVELYDSFISGNDVPEDERIDRADVAAVYKCLRRLCQSRSAEVNLFAFARRVAYDNGIHLDYFKTRICFDILQELNLLKYSADATAMVEFNPNYQRVELKNSPIWQRIKKTAGES